jgi:Zn-dependent protease with chaperone function
MGVAISAIVAALSVIFALSVTTTTTPPITSILQVLLDLRTSGRILSADEAMTALLFAVTVYLVVFSLTYFLMRFFGLLLLALGVPDENTIRDTRAARRNVSLQTEMYRRQAKLIARYMMKANEAQVAQAKRRTSAATNAATSTGRNLPGTDALG